MQEIDACQTIHTEAFTRDYAAHLESRISSPEVQMCGFGSLPELVRAYFVDSVAGTFQDPITTKEGIARIFENRELIPAVLLYRNLEDIEGPIPGGEFLARRFVPGQGISTPADWIQAIDQFGFRHKLSEVDFDTAITYPKSLGEFLVSMNLREGLLFEDGFDEVVEHKKQEHKTDHIAGACFEIPESTFPHFEPEQITRLQVLQTIGFDLALDDCGAANTEALFQTLVEAEIQLSTLKIDGKLTASALHDQTALKKWIEKAEAQKTALIFEGSYPELLSPQVLEALWTLREAIGSTVPWYTQGPIYTDASREEAMK